ncbi:hypothetical protein [Murimonas intestini]|uniref:hypothetical protein n=1 Tax=Murimonas intestini TaxID=1337051 RepID=UPI0011DC85E4|nr:hypothetical protein [Murimonas intestini]
MIEKKENVRHKLFVIVLLMIAGVMITTLSAVADGTGENMEVITKEVMVNTKKDTQIIIYTYSGEQYVAEGKMDVLQSGSGEAETVLELQGSIKKQDNTEKKDMDTKKREQISPTVLTVYMDETIYGFYATHPVTVRSQMGKNIIEIYGYLEAYYDGENYYSA